MGSRAGRRARADGGAVKRTGPMIARTGHVNKMFARPAVNHPAGPSRRPLARLARRRCVPAPRLSDSPDGAHARVREPRPASGHPPAVPTDVPGVSRDPRHVARKASKDSGDARRLVRDVPGLPEDGRRLSADAPSVSEVECEGLQSSVKDPETFGASRTALEGSPAAPASASRRASPRRSGRGDGGAGYGVGASGGPSPRLGRARKRTRRPSWASVSASEPG